MLNDVLAEKATLRARMRAARVRVRPDEAAAVGARAAAWIVEQHRRRPLHVVALYAALPGEADVAAVDAELRGRGVATVFPRVEAPGVLSLRRAARHALAVGTHGICEPPADAPAVNPDEVDLVVVPGLAFDADGGRLGFGGGYYDRLLARAPSALRVGVCLPFQLVPRVPHGALDERVDVVVSGSVVVTAARPFPLEKEETP